MKGTVAPLDRVNDPWAVEPTAPPAPAATSNVHVSDTAPAPAVTAVTEVVPEVATPFSWMLHAVGDAFEEPVFWRDTLQMTGATLGQDTNTADT